MLARARMGFPLLRICQPPGLRHAYDPTIGIMHEGNDGSSKFIFDLMELQRPRVERAVLGFVKATVFDPADFTIRTDGVCRLNPEMMVWTAPPKRHQVPKVVAEYHNRGDRPWTSLSEWALIWARAISRWMACGSRTARQ